MHARFALIRGISQAWLGTINFHHVFSITYSDGVNNPLFKERRATNSSIISARFHKKTGKSPRRACCSDACKRRRCRRAALRRTKSCCLIQIECTLFARKAWLNNSNHYTSPLDWGFEL
jgi:hypothetical protein